MCFLNTPWRRRATLLACIGSVEFVIVLILCGKWYSIRSQMPQYIEQQMCVPRQTMATIEDDALQLSSYKYITNVTEEGQVKYCGTASNVLRWIAEGTLGEMYNDDEHPEYTFYHELIPSKCEESNQGPAIVKLTELDVARTKAKYLDRSSAAVKENFRTSEKNITVVWNTTNSFMSPGLKYIENQSCLEVEKDGLYFVTSQLVFESNMDSIRVKQSLHRTRNGTDDVVLEKEEEICQVDGKFERKMVKTSTMGAIFDLKSNDCLHITLNKLDYLVNGSSTGHHFIVYQTGL